MAAWSTISVLQPILAVLLTSALMVCDSSTSVPTEFILPTGSRIALATHANTCHKLSTFDVRAQASKLAMEYVISGVPPGKDIEHVKFDPSGEYLAVGRSDNIVQIFDTRMGAILHTLHHGESISTKPPSERYGITAMEWIVGWHGCGVRLLTGGEDGERSTIDPTLRLN
jgi:WD40 repeat protein